MRTPPLQDPTVVLRLGTYGDPSGVVVSQERGTLVAFENDLELEPFRSLDPFAKGMPSSGLVCASEDAASVRCDIASIGHRQCPIEKAPPLGLRSRVRPHTYWGASLIMKFPPPRISIGP